MYLVQQQQCPWSILEWPWSIREHPGVALEHPGVALEHPGASWSILGVAQGAHLMFFGTLGIVAGAVVKPRKLQFCSILVTFHNFCDVF